MRVMDHNGQPSLATTETLAERASAPLTNGFTVLADSSAVPVPPADPAPPPGPAEPAEAVSPADPASLAGLSAARGQSLRSWLAVLATGLVIGGLVGGVLAGPAGGHPASALVELVALPDPALAGVDSLTQPPDTLATYVAGEFAQLSGEGFRAAVAHQVGSASAPPIEVSRAGTSSVVTFSATGATDEAGLKVVQTAVELYTQRRTDEFRARIEDSIASVDRTLRDVEAPAVRADAGRQARVDRLLALRADLVLQSHRSRAPVRILAPAAVSGSSPIPPGLLHTVLGALVGGLLAIGARTLRRSRTTIILTAADAATVTGRVLYPQVQLSSAQRQTPLRVLRPYDKYASRLLVAQIAGARPLGGRVIAVVGASPASASRRVAAMIAAGAAAQTPTLLAEFAERGAEQSRNPDARPPGTRHMSDWPMWDWPAPDWPMSDWPLLTRTPGLAIMRVPPVRSGKSGHDGWATLLKTISEGRHCVVVDAGSSPELLRQLPVPAETVLAVGLGVDSKPHAAALASAIPAATGGLLGVITRLPWHEQWRALGRAWSHA